MSSVPLPSAVDSSFASEEEPPVLEAPAQLVARYLELSAQRRAIEDQLAFVRSELELVAASLLSDAVPRGRFLGPSGGAVAVRLQPTCFFDKGAVAKELQRVGRLSDVAVLNGPMLARFLAKEPALAARLGDRVRQRRSVVLMAQG